MTFRQLSIAEEILCEVDRQTELWGEQNHPDGTGLPDDFIRAEAAKILSDHKAYRGELTYRDILDEEAKEVYAETDPVKIREELVQVAAVALSWIDAIDRRSE